MLGDLAHLAKTEYLKSARVGQDRSLPLDEVVQELTWANNNALDIPQQAGAISAFRRITSMSLDPTVRDFQVNAVDPATVAMLREQAANEASSEAGTQRSLF